MTLHDIGNLPVRNEYLSYIRIFMQQAGFDLTPEDCTRLIAESGEGEKVKDIIKNLTSPMGK